MTRGLQGQRRHNASAIPEGFSELLFEGIGVRHGGNTTLCQVGESMVHVRAQGLHDAPSQLLQWLRGSRRLSERRRQEDQEGCGMGGVAWRRAGCVGGRPEPAANRRYYR